MNEKYERIFNGIGDEMKEIRVRIRGSKANEAALLQEKNYLEFRLDHHLSAPLPLRRRWQKRFIKVIWQYQASINYQVFLDKLWEKGHRLLKNIVEQSNREARG